MLAQHFEGFFPSPTCWWLPQIEPTFWATNVGEQCWPKCWLDLRRPLELKGFNKDHDISHIELKCNIKNQVKPYLYKTIQCGNTPGKINIPILGIICPAEKVNQVFD